MVKVIKKDSKHGVHKTKECGICHKEMRSNNLKRHMETCTGKAVKRIVKTKTTRGLQAQMYDTLKNYTKVYHVCYKKHCLKEQEAKFEDLWRVINDFKCNCEGKESHTHMLAEWIGQGHYHRAKVSSYFVEKKAYWAVEMDTRIAKDGKRILSTIAYIQTESGWHKKSSHDNSNLFKTLSDNIQWHKEFFNDKLWAQCIYAQFLAQRIERIESLLLKVSDGMPLTPLLFDRILKGKDLYKGRLDTLHRQYGKLEQVSPHLIEGDYLEWRGKL